MSAYFFFNPALVMLVPVAGVCFFCSLVWSWLCFQNFRFLSCRSFLFFLFCSKDSAALVWTDFAFLALGFSGREEALTVVFWICTFKTVLLEGQWPREHQISESRTMVLDLRLVLVSPLTTFCNISSKSMASQSCCFISTLIEGLRPFRK